MTQSGGEETGYEYPVETKFIQVTQRSANWHTIDIKAGMGLNKGELVVTDFYTENKSHVITVFGRAPNASNIYFAGAQSSGEGGQSALTGHTFTPGESSEFTLTRTFTWAEISRNNDIRINGFDAGIPYINFYEITIVDEDDLEVYALSKDPDVQSKDHGTVILQEDPPIGTTWLVGAFGGSTPNAIGKVFDPSTASGPCCDDCDDGCFDCENGLCEDDCTVTCCLPPFNLAALEALSGGITLTPVGDALPVFGAETKVAKFEIVPIDPAPANNNNYAPSSGITFTWAQAGITNWANIGGKQSVIITYAAFVESGTPDAAVKKDATNWSANGMDLNYPTLAAGPANTLTYTGAQIGAASTGIAITANSWNKPNCAAVYYIKILGVEISACPDCGEDVCICLPCNCYCADCVEAESCGTNGADCDDGCACDCHYWDGDLTEKAGTFNLALVVDTTTPGGAFVGNTAPVAMEVDDGKLVLGPFVQEELSNSSGNIGWIALTPAQTTMLTNAFIYGGTVTIKITAESSDAAATYRACLGDVTATSWNASNMFLNGAVISTVSGNAVTVTHAEPARALKHLIIQARSIANDPPDTITITEVEITITAP